MKKALLGLLLVAGLAGAADASPITISGSSGSRSASALFDDSGGKLTVTLTNTSTADALVPTDILTAVFFNYAGTTLTPVSAILNTGSQVYLDGAPVTVASGNVGGEWAYNTGLTAPGGASSGISSSGFDLFGSSNFNGPDLSPPLALDGVQYGITSAGDVVSTQNGGLAKNEIIKNSVIFTFSGANIDTSLISDVSFQYGTSLDEPNVPGDGHIIEIVPEPASAMLLGAGLLALLYSRRQKNRVQ